MFRDKTPDKLCAHLRSMGLGAQLLPEHPLMQKVGAGEKFLARVAESVAGVFGVAGAWESIGVIQIAGGNISYVYVARRDVPSWDGGSYPEYRVDYLVSQEKYPLAFYGKTALRKQYKRKVPFSHEVVDIEWEKGGVFTDRGLDEWGFSPKETLGKRLNADLSLKDSLLMLMREESKGGEFEIEVVDFELAHQLAAIRVTYTRSPRLSPGMFDCLDRIARHIIKCASSKEEEAKSWGSTSEDIIDDATRARQELWKKSQEGKK